jgi:hypothetical protein
MFSPKFAVLAALLVSLLMGIVLVSMQGAKAGPANGLSAAGSAPAAASAPAQAASSLTTGAAQPAAVLGSATLDLGLVAKSSSIDDADNVRWSLVRTTGDTAGLYVAQSGVDWKALRQVSRAGSFVLAAGSTWSFNATFQEGVGYKQASGVLAGGQCALATVIRGAAIRASLPTKAKQHRYAIPGFALADTVNIWWGRDDLTVQNPGGQDLLIAWELTPQTVKVSFIDQ